MLRRVLPSSFVSRARRLRPRAHVSIDQEQRGRPVLSRVRQMAGWNGVITACPPSPVAGGKEFRFTGPSEVAVGRDQRDDVCGESTPTGKIGRIADWAHEQSTRVSSCSIWNRAGSRKSWRGLRLVRSRMRFGRLLAFRLNPTVGLRLTAVTIRRAYYYNGKTIPAIPSNRKSTTIADTPS